MINETMKEKLTKNIQKIFEQFWILFNTLPGLNSDDFFAFLYFFRQSKKCSLKRFLYIW